MRKDKTIKRNMNELIKALNKRAALLERSIKLAEKEEKTLPDGRLRVSRKQYYKITANHPKATTSQGLFASRIMFSRNPQPAGFWNIIQEIMTFGGHKGKCLREACVKES